MEFVEGVLQALFMLLGAVLWLLPILIALWVLQKLANLSQDVSHLTRQLTALAEHTGAPVVAQPAASRRGPRTPLWAFVAVLVVFLLVMGGIYVVPGLSSDPADLRLVPVDGTHSDSAVPEPARELPPMPEPVQETPGD